MKCSRLASILWVLLILAPGLGMGAEPAARQAVQRIEEEWAEIFYRLPLAAQAKKLAPLLPRLQALAHHYPVAAEPLVMEALVLCALAAADTGLGSLGRVERARALLVKSLALDPLAMEGSAHVTLGNLYYRLPGWPIAFGDDELARQHLETALKLFPEGLDTNYFYGDFLLEQDEFTQALPYLEKAEKAPIRPTSRLSDLQLKQELKQALKDAREENTERSNFFSRLLKSVME
jgi:tetratricopeptide (TPR) repeat protein